MRGAMGGLLLVLVSGGRAFLVDGVENNQVGGGPPLHPVVLVPGNGGNQLEAKVDKPSTVSYWCYKTRDWHSLWLNPKDLVGRTRCWADNIRLVYDPTTRTTGNAPGVQIRVPGWGTTTSMEYISQADWGFAAYFAGIVSGLVGGGYTRGATLRGAPYDFRKAANEQGEYFAKLKLLVEESYTSHGATPVILVSHSMGSLMLLYFLQHQTQEWKEQHIRSFISLAGPWGGLVRSIKVFAVGDTMGSWVVSAKDLVEEQRTDPSLAWLLPQEGFWPDHEVLVRTVGRNYTRPELREFFLAYSQPAFVSMMEDTQGLVRGQEGPGVPTHCIHGTQVATTSGLVYPPGTFPPSSSWWQAGPTLVQGDGDGTVNLRSLQGCLRWGGHSVTHRVFPGIHHSDILKDEGAVAHVVGLVNTMNQELGTERALA